MTVENDFQYIFNYQRHKVKGKNELKTYVISLVKNLPRRHETLGSVFRNIHTCTHMCMHSQERKLVLHAYKPSPQGDKAEDLHNFKAILVFKVKFQVIQG